MRRRSGAALAAELLELVLEKKLKLQDVRTYQALGAYVSAHGRAASLLDLARAAGFGSHSRLVPSVRRLKALGLVSDSRDDPGLRVTGTAAAPERPRKPRPASPDPDLDPRLAVVWEAQCCATCAHWRPVRIGRHGCIANSHLRAGQSACGCCRFHTRRPSVKTKGKAAARDGRAK